MPDYQRLGLHHRESRTPWKPGKVVVPGRVDAYPGRMIAAVELQVQLMIEWARVDNEGGEG